MSEGGNVQNVQHNAQMPLRYWLNLFAFFGYDALVMDERDSMRFQNRGRLLMYNRTSAAAHLPKLEALVPSLTGKHIAHTVGRVHWLPELLQGTNYTLHGTRSLRLDHDFRVKCVQARSRSAEAASAQPYSQRAKMTMGDRANQVRFIKKPILSDIRTWKRWNSLG